MLGSDRRQERATLRRYERALRKIARKGRCPVACDRESKPSRSCHCFLCIAKTALEGER